MLKKILRSTNFIRGEFERALGRQIQHIGTSRQALEQWLTQLSNVPPPKGRVLITALRNYTWIEWAVYCASVIRKMGYSSTLIFNQSEVKKLFKAPAYYNFWRRVNSIPEIQLRNLEELSYNETDYNRYYIQNKKNAVTALAYDYHIESDEIIKNPEKYYNALILLREKGAKNAARMLNFCKTNKFHIFFCYSGLIHDTSMLLNGAIDAGQETICIEGWAWRPGHLIYNFNAPSLEYNVKGWMNYLSKFDEKMDSDIKKYFDFLDGAKPDDKWLNNFYNVQKSNIATALPYHIKNFIRGNEKIFLMACNVIGDSSMINRETIFESHKEFIIQTVSYFKDHSNLKLIIRAHPGESWVKSKVTVRMGELAAKIAKHVPNVLVIDSDEKVNTFSLLPFIQAGLIWISSAGADLVARGIPVICAAKPKYSGLGFVTEPATKSEFFNQLCLHAKNDIRPNEAQIQKAKEYLYLVFKGFSFEAFGRNFRASTCRLGSMPSQEEHDRFYRILLKEEPAPDHIIN
jgi:hypothetical protein